MLVVILSDSLPCHFEKLLEVHLLQLTIQHVLRNTLRRSCHSIALMEYLRLPHPAPDRFHEGLDVIDVAWVEKVLMEMRDPPCYLLRDFDEAVRPFGR